MTLKLDIATSLEQRIVQEARRRGLDTKSFVLAFLEEQFAAESRNLKGLREIELLEEINRGFSPETWQRYSELIAKREDEDLSAREHRELVALSDRIELAQANRLELLSELASRRETSLESLMAELGIQPRAHA